MGGLLDDIIYFAAAPLRLFGRSRRLRRLLGACAVVASFFALTLWAMDRYLPPDNDAITAAAKLPPMPSLPPLTRASYIIAPVAIAIGAIQNNLEASTPRTVTGKSGNPVAGILSQADIGMAITRGNIAVNGKANELTVLTQLNGTLSVTGPIAAGAGTVAGGVTGGIAGLFNSTLGKDLGKSIGGLTNRVLDQNVELRSQVTVRAKPAFAANWRLEPNLSAQVAVSDSAVQIAGFRINMANEARPLIERAVNDEITALERRLRNDLALERAAREQWSRMCRSIPLGGGDTGLPPLWLEVRPVRATAGPPQIDARNMTLAIGVETETRVTATEHKPECPFPARLDLVPPMKASKLDIVVPIDVPFSDINKLLNAQFKGHRYPEGTDAPVEVEVRNVGIAAADDRMLISLKVKAHERTSWFGFGAEANVHVWGKPKLDPGTQVLRLTDISLAVESEAAFGLLGTAARAAMPYLQQALADKAVIDMTPFLADAKARIGTALAEFRQNRDGVAVDAAVDTLRLTGIAFDSRTLRVIAEAEGSAKVAVTELPRM